MCINGELSETCQIDLGVPQRSILGPLLFSVYVNSLPTCVKKCRMILYADDAVLIYAASTPDSLQDAFVLDFKLMCDWYTNLSQQLGYRLSVFNRILHLLDKNARLAYYNGLVLQHLDYADTVWGNQPGMKSEMEHLQRFQNRFAKKIVDSKLSFDEAIAVLKWIPLTRRRFGH